MAISISSAAAYMLCLQTNRSMATYLKNGHWQEIGRLAYLPIDIEPLTYQAQVYPEYGAPQISDIFFMYT